MREPSDNFRDVLLACATLVLWSLCAAGGAIGYYVPYPRPAPPKPELQTQLVQVDLPPDAAAPPPPAPPEVAAPLDAESSSPPAAAPVPAAPPPPALAEAPAITPVAAPTAAVAFAVPVEGLTRIVDVSQAAHGAPPHPAAPGASGGAGPTLAPAPPAPRTVAPPIAAPPAAPPVAHLTFGQGEGRQPPPEYPRDAVQAGQEGTVVLRFQVDETGRVTSVNVAAASRWPLLNQAAVRAVRDTWRFAPGSERLFEVPIEFQLSRN